MTRELLQQALDALNADHHFGDYQDLCAALREALAAPMPEPVAWAMLRADGLVLDVICPDERDAYQGEYTVPLYAAPPAAPAPVVPHPDEFVCPYCFDQGAAPVVREPQSREQQIAIREAHCNTASDEYFGARPQVDDATKRRIYEAGFKEGWESGIGTTGAAMADVPLPEPDFYCAPKSGKILSVHDYARGDHLQGLMRGYYEPVYYGHKVDAHAAAVTAAARDCRTCKWFHQPGDSPIPGCISHGRCYDADRYEPLPPVRLWRTT